MNRGLVKILSIVFFLPVLSAYGQSLFNGLNIPSHTKATALGGVMGTHPGNDVNFFINNPALLNDVNNHISFQHTFYFADISIEQLTFAHEFEKIGLLGFSVQYFNYGNFTAYDDTGVEMGEFSVDDYVITTGYSHKKGNFQFGGSIKLAASDFADYFASAILFDAGTVFRHPTQDLVVGIVIKNFGFKLTDYTEISSSSLPFDAQVAAAYKPAHMPVRFLVNLYNLTDFDDPYTSDAGEEEPGPFDKVFSHVSLGTEFLISKHFHLLAGYNHLRRQELKLENKSAGAGLSYGLEIAIKNFEFGYSRAHYTVGNAINQIGISVDLKEFSKAQL